MDFAEYCKFLIGLFLLYSMYELANTWLLAVASSMA